MELILYIIIGIIIGAALGWLLAKSGSASALQAKKEAAQLKYSELEKELVGYRATATSELSTLTDRIHAKAEEIAELKQTLYADKAELATLNNQLSTAHAELRATHTALREKNIAITDLTEEWKTVRKELSETNQALATAKAANQALDEKLQRQKEEMEGLGRKFNTEFENIANKILETKTEKFTALNKLNLSSILHPLGEKIQDFKKQVEDTYGKESNERASLKTEVKSLLDMNQQLAAEAKNLTRALKAEVKTQGRWGEVILEKILDKSGLRKGEEFFMEHQLYGEDGRPLLSAVTGKKMRPDALIKYPDDRHVIVD